MNVMLSEEDECEDTIAGVLLQKNFEAFEQPIAFMRRDLQNSELKYTIMEKQAYALVKSKTFQNILLWKSMHMPYSKVIKYVPHAAAKDILSQHDFLGIRGTWVSKIQEYDLEIKPTKLIKGHGLAKMLTHTNEKEIDMICENTRDEPTMTPILQNLDNH